MTKKLPGMPLNGAEFLSISKDSEIWGRLSGDDAVEVFVEVLKDGEDFTPELVREIVSDYGAHLGVMPEESATLPTLPYEESKHTALFDLTLPEYSYLNDVSVEQILDFVREGKAQTLLTRADSIEVFKTALKGESDVNEENFEAVADRLGRHDLCFVSYEEEIGM